MPADRSNRAPTNLRPTLGPALNAVLGALVLCALTSSAVMAWPGVLHAQTPPDEHDYDADTLAWAIPAFGLGLTWAYDDPQGTGQFLASYLTTVTLTVVFKRTVPEHRPNLSPSTESYVSGHTSSAFGGAAFIQMRYGWGWGLPAYLGAIYVGRSRIEEQAHFPSDVYRGAALAIVDAAIFTTRYRSHVQMVPYLAPHGGGVRLYAKW